MQKMIILFLAIPIFSFSQIGVNTTNPNAMLDVNSTNNGILIPRVQLTSITDVITVVNPQGGALTTSTLVYNLAPAGIAPNNVLAGFYYWNGTFWVSIAGNTTGWSLNGNGGTNATAPFNTNFSTNDNFLGTSDYKDLYLGTNNYPRMKLDAFGNIGIGVNNPFAKLHVYDTSSYITTYVDKRNLSGGISGYTSPTFVVNTTSTNGGTSEIYHNSEFLSNGINGATNVAAYFSASQAANNYAIIVGNGNVGIGTLNPTEKLHVFDNVDQNKSPIFGIANQLSTTTDYLNIGVKGSGNGNGSYGFGVGVLGMSDINNTWNSTGVYAQLGTASPTFSGASSINQAFVANGNGLGRAAMFLGGNIGIGLPLTTNPSTLLHISSATNGAVRIVDGTEANGKIFTSNATGVGTWQSPTPSGFTHYLGELYLGGIIFELYKGSDGLEHGLVVALTETTARWQTTATLVNANRSEDGAFNTALMTGSPAATYIATLGAGWYLPSIDELNILFNNRFYANKALRLGGFTLISKTAIYWSSTEYIINNSYDFLFFTGQIGFSDKTDISSVRGIRSF
ncbi:hypothetical protein OX283_013850 [Flavobacterium sp. SUN052]|uniref:hypothetical protein n=1 Tax=Flavobacterium sp. SUN052 TaxID=3002441 RepID=UPI00237E6461|nr:hypothetical protein [Flavobacterium sp. SUN052]MEC4005750.1 hypothetical protein [Flavobacterium sp. SUN052]